MAFYGILPPCTINRADWKTQSADWIESVYLLFKQYNAFFEYNSPNVLRRGSLWPGDLAGLRIDRSA